MTSNLDRVYAFQVRLLASETGLRIDSKAQAEQVRSISVRRLGAVLGRVSPESMSAIDTARRLHLGLT